MDPATDLSSENQVLNAVWEVAFFSALEDMDLDSTSTPITLQLVSTDPNTRWGFAYKYPTDCVFFRRIESGVVKDNRSSHITKRIGILGNQKVIYTNCETATAEYISNLIPINSLSSNAALAIAYKLASLSSALITGKGAAELRKQLLNSYIFFKEEAKEHDQRENYVYDDPEVESEFVEARLS